MHRHNPALYVEVNLKRLAVTIGFLIVLAYVAGTIALTIFWGNRPHSPITYVDVAWPGNWKNIRPKKGQMVIAQADEYFEKGKMREAFFLYRSGLRMYPADQNARLVYAKMLASANMLERAGNVLAEGLDYGYPENEEYLSILLQIISLQQNQVLLTEIAPKLLETEEIAGNPKKKYALLQQYMQAQILSGDYLGAIATGESINADPDAPFDGHNVIIASYLRMGAIDQAEAYIASLDEKTRQQPDLRLLEASTLAQSGQIDEMMSVLRQLFQDYPSGWKIQLSALQLIIRFAPPKQAEAYMDLFTSTHLGNPQALSGLAVFLTDLPDSKRMKHMLDFITEQRPQMAPSFEFFLVQALLTEGKFQESKKLYNNFILKVPADSKEINVIHAFGQILSATTDGGSGARTELLKILRAERFPPEVYWEAAHAMQMAGYEDTALEVLNVAADLYPTHPSLIALRDAVSNQDASIANKLSGDTLDNPLPQTPGGGYDQDSGRYNPGVTEKDLETAP